MTRLEPIYLANIVLYFEDIKDIIKLKKVNNNCDVALKMLRSTPVFNENTNRNLIEDLLPNVNIIYNTDEHDLGDFVYESCYNKSEGMLFYYGTDGDGQYGQTVHSFVVINSTAYNRKNIEQILGSMYKRGYISIDNDINELIKYYYEIHKDECDKWDKLNLSYNQISFITTKCKHMLCSGTHIKYDNYVYAYDGDGNEIYVGRDCYTTYDHGFKKVFNIKHKDSTEIILTKIRNYPKILRPIPTCEYSGCSILKWLLITYPKCVNLLKENDWFIPPTETRFCEGKTLRMILFELDVDYPEFLTEII